MKFAAFESGGVEGLAVEVDGAFRGLSAMDEGFPGTLLELVRLGTPALLAAGRMLATAPAVDLIQVNPLPPVMGAGKIVCVGLNYVDHSVESGFKTPTYPTLFARFNSSLIGHNAPILRPAVSVQLDFEGELVAVIGKRAKDVTEADALDHIAGYSIFNDGSIRDYQFKAPQWTPGKNFDDTGAFGPYFVTADELPPGCKGLQLTTRLNGQIVQQAMIDDMVFSVAALVSILSQFMTLEPGDVLVTGTPSGVGVARNPPLFMRNGDVCEVEIDGIGVLSNPIRDRAPNTQSKAS